MSLIGHKLGDRISVNKNYGELPQITCYPKQMNQVFMMLLMNAIQAMNGEGAISICTKRDAPDAVIEISDTGAGIDPEILPRIFDPGFTTKGVGVGTGLGLSICYKIIAEHDGRIDVASEVGKGSRFTLTIPIHQSPPQGRRSVPVVTKSVSTRS